MSTELAPLSTGDLQARKDYSTAVSAADVLPPAFRNSPPNILIATEVAASLGVTPFHLMQEMGIISGRPSFSAKFMRALVRRAGHKLRETTTPEGVARCVIIRSDDPGYEHVSEWDEKKARDHGYWGKGHWAKNPPLMLGNRALSECVRQACPEVLGGVAYTPDEIQDFAPEKHTVTQVDAPPPGERLGAKGLKSKLAADPEPEPVVTQADVDDANNVDDLRILWQSAGPDLRPTIEAKVTELQQAPTHVDEATGEVIDAEIGENDPWATEGASA